MSSMSDEVKKAGNAPTVTPVKALSDMFEVLHTAGSVIVRCFGTDYELQCVLSTEEAQDLSVLILHHASAALEEEKKNGGC